MPAASNGENTAATNPSMRSGLTATAAKWGRRTNIRGVRSGVLLLQPKLKFARGAGRKKRNQVATLMISYLHSQMFAKVVVYHYQRAPTASLC
eukprot:scaffold15612_cov75-Phaeocystis_antarctica.AAC.3